MRKSNTKLWNHLLKELKDFEISAGWFEDSRYDAETPIAGIAAVQNYGAHINQNVTDKQRNFLHLIGIHLKKTTEELNIIIPPRPFFDNAKRRIQGVEGKKILLGEMIKVFEGKQTMEQAANKLGMWLQKVIQEEIKKISAPPLAPSTIRQRNSQYDSKSKNISTKPLNDSGLMFNSVQYKAELKK